MALSWVIQFGWPALKGGDGLFFLEKPFTRQDKSGSHSSKWAYLSQIRENNLKLLVFNSKAAGTAFITGMSFSDSAGETLKWWRVVKAPV